MAEQFDLVVIGTGSAGSIPANKCRAAGWRVAIVDERPFGGTCALRGCDPKKVLVGAADLLERLRRMDGWGVAANGARIDWPSLMRFKRSFTDPVPEHRERAFRNKGIEVYHGSAKFLDATTVRAGERVLRGRQVLIASGARPRRLGIAGDDLLASSDEFLDLPDLPRRIAFAGGGFISFEFAHIAARAGAAVRILHRSARPLAGFDPDLVKLLVESSREAGIEVYLDCPVQSIERDGPVLRLVSCAGDRRREFEADLAVHGAGREPALEPLDLAAANVASGDRGVVVNEYLQSVSNPSVYAAGDCAATDGSALTPVAAIEGLVVAANLLNGNHRTGDYQAIPSVVFAVPPLARVGMLEHDARSAGLRYRVQHEVTSGWYSSRRIRESVSAHKVLVEEGSDRILGAHLLGYGAEETINLFALAMRSSMTAGALKNTAFAYPSRTSDIVYML